MTPEQAARAFFDACGKKDWDEVRKFLSPCDEQVKGYLEGCKSFVWELHSSRRVMAAGLSLMKSS